MENSADVVAALEWIRNKGDVTIPVSVVSLAQNCLSQMCHATTKTEFCVRLLNGFGSVLTPTIKRSFSEQVGGLYCTLYYDGYPESNLRFEINGKPAKKQRFYYYTSENYNFSLFFYIVAARKQVDAANEDEY